MAMIGLMGASALTAIISKQALLEVSPFRFVWLSFAIGLPLLLSYAYVWKGEPRPRALPLDIWLRLGLVGLLSYGAVRLLFMSGLERLPATTQAFLVNLVGLATMAFSALLLREYPARRQVIGALIALLGVKLFFREIPSPETMTGIYFVLAGVVALALVNVLIRGLVIDPRHRLGVASLTAVTLLVGAAPLLVWGLLKGEAAVLPSPRVLGAAALNATVGIAFGPVVFTRILKTLRSYEASVLAATSIIWVALLAIPLLGESLDMSQAGGIAVMLAGLVLTQLRPKRSAASTGEVEDLNSST
jgi:drug/metabolite transporter (DMT)-like permease